MKQKHYHATKIKPLIQLIIGVIKRNPSMLDNEGYLMAQLSRSIEGFTDPSKCLNCGASMAEYAEVIDINDALLLLSMAKIVRKRASTMHSFTEANKVRVSAEAIHHTQKCRTAKCRKLGLIAKAGGAEWSITERGWAGIRGEQIPKVRISFRNQITDRPEELTTFPQIFAEHKAKMQHKEHNRRLPTGDKRQEFSDYNPADWVHVSGYHQGTII